MRKTLVTVVTLLCLAACDRGGDSDPQNDLLRVVDVHAMNECHQLGGWWLQDQTAYYDSSGCIYPPDNLRETNR